jgi:hypothetical protein
MWDQGDEIDIVHNIKLVNSRKKNQGALSVSPYSI